MSSAILLVTSQAKSVHSGVGTYARLLLDSLRAMGAEAPAVTVATWREEVDRERQPWCEWIDLGPRSTFDATPGRFWSFGRRFARRLGSSTSRFDLVHFLDAREGYAVVGQRNRRGVRVVGTVHDDYAALVGRSPLHYFGRAADPLRRWLFHRWLRGVERRAYARFDGLFVNSAATGRTLREQYGLQVPMWPTTLTIASGGADRTVRLAGDPALLFCGGNFHRKGLDTCVRALSLLRATLPAARLHVIGSCRSQPTIERLARRLSVTSMLEFHGRLPADEVARRMAGADQFVMPSRTEALGLVYLEAFRASVPVIAGDRGGVVDLVQHRRSGLLVAPEDVQALAVSIDELHHDAALRQRLVAGGREVLAARTPARLLDETLRGYGLPAMPHEPLRVPAMVEVVS